MPLPAGTPEARVPPRALRARPLLLIPQPYPGFLPLTYSPARSLAFRLADAEILQVSVGQIVMINEPLRVEIASVVLE